MTRAKGNPAYTPIDCPWCPHRISPAVFVGHVATEHTKEFPKLRHVLGAAIDTMRPYVKGKPRVLVDFDGVIHLYSNGWGDGTIYDPPVPGAREAMALMEKDGYEVVIFSTRDGSTIRKWMQINAFPRYRVTNMKEPAVAYIDDRGIRFVTWGQSLTELYERYPVESK